MSKTFLDTKEAIKRNKDTRRSKGFIINQFLLPLIVSWYVYEEYILSNLTFSIIYQMNKNELIVIRQIDTINENMYNLLKCLA